ncbi:MAG TPA: hypothetical protein PKJ37_11825, partial [Acidobacteriota bacterium]|nr:hypothetical protein [Acidobacteriota bacterium]HNT18567.1 hypothetical protein [Acidobacteriota bacterium]
MHGKNYLKVLGMVLVFAFAFTSSFAQATGPSYSDSWTAAPGFVPQMPFATISENENVNIYNGNLTVIYPIGPAIPVGPELSFQAKLRYMGPGSGEAFGFDNAGGWTVFYGALTALPQYAPNDNSGGSPICGGCNLTYYDADGTPHALYMADEINGITLDGSNIKAEYGNGVWILYYPDGKIVELADSLARDTVPCSGCPGYTADKTWAVTKVSDRFGNSYSIVNQLFVDMLTNVQRFNITSIYDSSPNNNSGRGIYFDYSSSPTGYITNLLSSISVPVPYLNGGNPGYADYYFNFTTLQGQSSSSVARLSRIDFPKAKITDSNNLFMSFSYYSHDPSIPGFDEKGSALQRITYPTGGYTQYDYASYIYDFNTSYYPKPDTQQPGQSVKVKWVGGFGVTTVKKNDGTNNTVRQWERFDMQYINPNSTTCDDFGFAQETLPDGQKILHLYKIPTSKQGGAGYELYTLYFANDSAFSWERARRFAYNTYSGCSYDSSPGDIVNPVRVVSNTWKRMAFSGIPNANYSENWQVIDSKTEEKNSSSGSTLAWSEVRNAIWDGHGHFLLTSDTGSHIQAGQPPYKITIRQYIPPHASANLRNREEFEATFYSATPPPTQFAGILPDDCADCGNDPSPSPSYDISVADDASAKKVVTAGISQFLETALHNGIDENPELNNTGSADKRIALAIPTTISFSLKNKISDPTPTNYNYLYWEGFGNAQNYMASSDDWVETRTYNLTDATNKQYRGTIEEIHLAYKGDTSKGVKYEYEYGVVKSKQFLGMGYKEAERSIDPNTGMILSEHDANGIGAGYSYDNLLRLTKIAPTQSEAAEYIWYPVEGGYTKRIEYGRGYNPDPTGENHTLGNLATHKVFHFDGLGRLTKSKEIMADGSYSVVEKAYDPNGREFFVSEPFKEGDVSRTGYVSFDDANVIYALTSLPRKNGDFLFGTASSIYPGFSYSATSGQLTLSGQPDPLGRVMKVIKPDGNYTDTTYDGYNYTVALHNIEGVTGNSLTTYEKDAFGRLVFVDAPNNDNIKSADAEYFYDSQDRLVKVDLDGQIRTFTYDNLGFLTSSENPENGLVTIDNPLDPYDGYDVWGNILRYQDANGVAGGYKIKNTYDAKGRIRVKEKIDASGNFLARLNEWIYDGA